MSSQFFFIEKFFKLFFHKKICRWKMVASPFLSMKYVSTVYLKLKHFSKNVGTIPFWQLYFEFDFLKWSVLFSILHFRFLRLRIFFVLKQVVRREIQDSTIYFSNQENDHLESIWNCFQGSNKINQKCVGKIKCRQNTSSTYYRQSAKRSRSQISTYWDQKIYVQKIK